MEAQDGLGRAFAVVEVIYHSYLFVDLPLLEGHWVAEEEVSCAQPMGLQLWACGSFEEDRH